MTLRASGLRKVDSSGRALDPREGSPEPSFGKAEAPEKVIDFPTTELKRLAGLDLDLPEMRRVLQKLGFFVAGQGGRVKVAAPS